MCYDNINFVVHPLLLRNLQYNELTGTLPDLSGLTQLELLCAPDSLPLLSLSHTRYF